MSLHTLANHLQSAGRGEDKVLVHMTPKEVNGLQSLAMAHGGSLTINPETGLPEAGFLSAILPMVAGFFLGPAGIGLTAMQSALTVGALGTAATGSLGKGFMMGLGAYGGAGLGAGLTSAGAANLPAKAAGETAANLGGQGSAFNIPADKLAPSNFGAETVANTASNTTSTAGGINAYQGYPSNTFANTAGTNVNAMYTPQVPTGITGARETLQSGLVNPPVYVQPPPISPNIVTAENFIPQVSPSASLDVAKAGLNTADAGIKYGTDIAQTMRNTATPVNNIDQIMSQGTPPSTMDKLGAGFDRATGSWEGAKEVWNATPTGTGYGLAATGLSVLQSQQEEAAEEAKAEADAKAASRRGTMRPYEFSTELTENAFAPRESSSEFKYYVEPRFIPKETYKVAKEGGLMSLAVGGPVEDMSAANAMGSNTGYPMASLQTPMYSNPMVQRPMPTNVINSGIDAPVNAYTGEQRMAAGGIAEAVYPMMEQQLALKGSNLQAQGYAGGGTPASAKNPKAKMNQAPVPWLSYQPQYAGTPGRPYSGAGGNGHGAVPGFMDGVNRLMNDKINGQQQPIPQTSSGVAPQPYMPPQAQLTTPIAPNINTPAYQTPEQQLGLNNFYANMNQQLGLGGYQGYAEGGTANGGYSLGGYSDGGRLLRGPGDGVSDSIPASIGDHQPARLADGEFVVPARIVSEIGNGSTEAGARKLYAMMDRVQKARKKTVGKSKVAVNTRADKLLPA